MFNKSHLGASLSIFEHLAETLDASFSVKIGDEHIIPLGKNADKHCYIEISEPGVLGALLRKPSLETLVTLYATGHIDVVGKNLIEFIDLARQNIKKQNIKKLNKWLLLRKGLPLIFARRTKKQIGHSFGNDETGFKPNKRDEKEFIQFHYNVSNEFYQLFLDPKMLYSCAYFTEWDNMLEQAQIDKLDMICRKLRLKPGEKMLDIGCGWGALACYAAQHYGVTVQGVTLSERQHTFAIAKVKELGLEDKVNLELKDYRAVEGTFDKISSIGMFEHIGLDNFPEYFGKINSLLRDRGIVLNHGIGERYKNKKGRKIRSEKRMILKHIFPGSELTDIGTVTQAMEHAKLEVQDVENWRGHYAQTCKLWCQRLTANKAQAVKLVGEEKYRMWIAYLAGVHIGFKTGPLRIYQVVASKHKAKGLSELPPTRADLYHHSSART